MNAIATTARASTRVTLQQGLASVQLALRVGLVAAALAALSGALPAQSFLSLLFGNPHHGGAFQIALGSAPAGVHCCDSSCNRWEPGHYAIVSERVVIPGCVRQVWVPPCYRTEWNCCGEPVQVLVRAGYFRTVRDPDRTECVKRRVWQPGRWRRVCGDC